MIPEAFITRLTVSGIVRKAKEKKERKKHRKKKKSFREPRSVKWLSFSQN